MNNKLKELGIIKIIAVLAYIASLVVFFLPISFEWNNVNNNFFVAAGYSANNPMFTMIATIILIIAAIFLIMGKSSQSLIAGLLSIVLFVILLVSIPDKEPRGTIQVILQTGAYISPILAVIGTTCSLISFITERAKNIKTSEEQ